MNFHVGDGRRSGRVTASCDNVIAWRIGEACQKAAAASAGDYIDRGLALLHELEAKGFDIVVPGADGGITGDGRGEAVAWKHACNALCVDGLELWIDRCPHCGKPAPQQQQAAPGAVPLESSQAASDAIDAMLAEYNYPSNTKNAARAGWRACRLYSAPKPQEPGA